MKTNRKASAVYGDIGDLDNGQPFCMEGRLYIATNKWVDGIRRICVDLRTGEVDQWVSKSSVAMVDVEEIQWRTV
jgi:hypothetical protein